MPRGKRAGSKTPTVDYDVGCLVRSTSTLKGGNERRLRAVSCETIYAFIYRAAQRAEQLWRYLTRRHKRRRPRRSRPSQDTIKDRVSIHERPKTVDGRTEGGHWEGDLIICKRTRPVLVLHERKSRVTLAARLAGKTAAETISVMLAVFARIEPALRKSITFDNDTAFAQHALLRTMRAMTTWFCDAYASWQKGGVENANGRLRRWLPRQIDIDQVSDEKIQDIVITANLTPRKYLGFSFAWGYANHRERILKPMIRETITEPWREISWEEAIGRVASEFKRIQATYGRGSIGGITSSRCTDEETFLVQKLVRATFGNNNVDTCARVCHSPTGYGLSTTFGTSAGTQDLTR